MWFHSYCWAIAYWTCIYRIHFRFKHYLNYKLNKMDNLSGSLNCIRTNSFIFYHISTDDILGIIMFRDYSVFMQCLNWAKVFPMWQLIVCFWLTSLRTWAICHASQCFSRGSASITLPGNLPVLKSPANDINIAWWTHSNYITCNFLFLKKIMSLFVFRIHV